MSSRRRLSASVVRLKPDVAGPGEILPEEMRRAGLERLAVLHHRLDAQGVHRPGEPFLGGFVARESPVCRG
jgi:hypothetical protein